MKFPVRHLSPVSLRSVGTGHTLGRVPGRPSSLLCCSRSTLGPAGRMLVLPMLLHVTRPEIRIGNVMPYTGSLEALGAIGRAEAAYFEMINQRGGINGRKILLRA